MDTLANMLVSVKNANAKIKETVDVPFSNVKENIARLLEEEGFIAGYRVVAPKDACAARKAIRIMLKYSAGKQPVIKGLKRISKPSLRVYRSYRDIPKVRAAFGVTIVSTSKGLLTDRNARREKIGGEVLCQVW